MEMHASPNCAQSVEKKTHVSSFFLVQSHVLVSSFAMTHSKKTLLQIGIFPRTWTFEFCYFRRLA